MLYAYKYKEDLQKTVNISSGHLWMLELLDNFLLFLVIQISKFSIMTIHCFLICRKMLKI
jgi:hypothetical protein